MTFQSQLAGSLLGALFGLATGGLVYGALKSVTGLRLTSDEERLGADFVIHKIGANLKKMFVWAECSFGIGFGASCSRRAR